MMELYENRSASPMLIAQQMEKETGKNPFRMLPTGNEKAVWVEPSQVCVVEYMPNTLQSLRQFEIQYIEKSWHLC